MTESNRRMKQEIMGKDPRFDMDRLMHESNQAVANATVKRGEVIRDTSPIQGRITSSRMPGQPQPNINLRVNMVSNEAEQNQLELERMGKLLVDTQMQNFELEQDMAILRKKFTVLLA